MKNKDLDIFVYADDPWKYAKPAPRKRKSKITENSFFYFISIDRVGKLQRNRYLICDPELCAKSSHSFDMMFNDLANNEKLLAVLNLLYLRGHKDWPRMFANYLSAFCNNQVRRQAMYTKLQTNPKVRVLVTDDELRKKFREALKSSPA